MKKILSFCLSFLLAASLYSSPVLGCYYETAEVENSSTLDDL